MSNTKYEKIREIRQKYNISQCTIARHLCCSQRVYSNYELAQWDIPTDILIKLSAFYNVSVDYLLGLTNNPKRNK